MLFKNLDLLFLTVELSSRLSAFAADFTSLTLTFHFLLWTICDLRTLVYGTVFDNQTAKSQVLALGMPVKIDKLWKLE